MESSSGKLVDLALVSKYYPVANYSYPRKASTSTNSTNCYSNSRCSSNSSCRGRESLGSDGSAPGLIEDRTDSEVSVDDDYQYHAHTAELWDSFWPHRASSKVDEGSRLVPNKQYPALIPSPHRKKPSLDHENCEPPSWPLPNGASSQAQTQTRKAAATYSPFPKLSCPPPTRALPPVPARKERKATQRPSTSCGSSSKPLRPPRPSETLLTPCIQQPTFTPVSFAMPELLVQRDEDLSPISPTSHPRPTTSAGQRECKSLDEPSFNRRSHCTIYSVISHSATHLPAPEIRPSPIRAPRHFKSLAVLSPTQPEPEPHSVFEDDSDTEEEHSRKLFSFHKRSDSDHKRRRNRSNTSPAQPPVSQEQDSPSNQGARPLSVTPIHQKRHGHDVFGRLLGRRSR
ncbi:hypothetical protein VFPPC_08584 [Pochonia chlamydosporia 170]|uniref:Uncharacterized protein n=1 Tax=Pochonia chlamydosporia 170 TaxID=1380566 RepID=A0A179FNE6_METCM|nr:hypothetical protein VFPPC_08584 [Pochonia chlamydosporia 170]OAQ67136.1 hypothetical protein VFPPC_08584 [Pochonia chlamydosporia 170]